MKCKICDSTTFSIYCSTLKVDLKHEDEIYPCPIVERLQKYTELELIKCSNCDTTVWKPNTKWYPFYEEDKKWWDNKYKSNKIYSSPQFTRDENDKLNLFKNIPLEELKEMLAQIKEK